MENAALCISEMMDCIRKNSPSADMERIEKAVRYADSMHEGQLRKDGSPYITHPIHVAEIVSEIGLDTDSIVAALLHDCIEDTESTFDDISKMFGRPVAELVEGVTKLTRVNYTSQEEEQMENLRKMFMAMAKDIRVILIKIADRLHNMRTMDYQSEVKQKEKSLETMEIYAPLAHRLGMQKIKWELEDRSLMYLDPIGYREITDYLQQRRQTHQQFMSTIQSMISQRLEEHGIQAQVYGRIKHIYSIYRKMYSQNKGLDEVYDLCAFRVIVDDIPNCYNVLGHIHDLFRLVPGRFKDYISTPKPNMYQSLHTTVIGSEGIPFEVQIRTQEMHNTAEYGIAAHWKYKEGISGSLGGEEKLEWIRRLLEGQEDADPEDYIHSLKVDMFDDEVFVFTPRGEVINLPNGSTPIDFAYAIHSEVGNHMISANVNNRIVPFDHVLQNGDIVEVTTSQSSKGPSRDWQKRCKSNQAKNKIKQWFKREKREENVALGRSSFEAELKRAGISPSALTSKDVLPHILKKISFGTMDDMYAAIGYGGLTAVKAVNRVRDELIRINKLQQAREGEKSPTKLVSQPKKARNEKGIIVEGLDNCLIKFARCCTPVPGDPVVGFITRGYGVSVHRRDCANAAEADDPEKADRWVKVSWADDAGRESFTTSMEIVAQDRSALILDVATAIATLKVKTTEISAKSVTGGMALIHLSIEVKDLEQLRSAKNLLANIKGVSSVKRTSG